MNKTQEEPVEKENLSDLQICWNVLEDFAQRQKLQLFNTNEWQKWRDKCIIFSAAIFVGLAILKRLSPSISQNLVLLGIILILWGCLGIIVFELLSSRKIKNDNEFKFEKLQSSIFTKHNSQKRWYEAECEKIQSKISDSTVLSILKQDLERIIEEKELKNKNLDSFIFIIAVIIIYFLYNLLVGDFAEAISKNKLQITTVVFLITLTTSILKMYFYDPELKYLIIYKRCKFLI